VSTLGLEPEHFFLTTGTFNLVVKDRKRRPPERDVFSPERSRTNANPSVLETLVRYRRATLLSTHCPHRISTRFSQYGELYTNTWRSFWMRNRTHLPLQKSSAISARAEAEDSN